MPHFVVECSADVLSIHDESTINQKIFEAACSTELFNNHDVKVRIHAFKTYVLGYNKEPFIQVCATIMEGRTIEQKAFLSKTVVAKLAELFPDISQLAMSVNEFERATYFKKGQL